MQVADLKDILSQLGFDYRARGAADNGAGDGIGTGSGEGDRAGGTTKGQANWQDTCPRCRRADVTLAQTARVAGFG